MSATTSRLSRSAFTIAALAVLSVLLLPAAAQAQPGNTYQVTITNLTESQPITPPVVVTHQVGVHLFVPGEAIPEPMIPLVEEGKTDELVAFLDALPQIHDVAVGEGPLPPGASTTVEVQARGKFLYLSAVGMLATTNDAFFGLDSHFLLGAPFTRHENVPAYDAGSEEDDELCQFIPGPPCENLDVRATENAEGFVHVHAGIKGVGDLPTDEWSWHNPVVRIDVTRLAPGQGNNGNGNGNGNN